MAITYTAPTTSEIGAEDKTVEVTYTNDASLTHTRTINVPRIEDGSIDEVYYQEILEGQLRGVENKIRVGAVTFTDPNAVAEDAEGAGEEAPTE